MLENLIIKNFAIIEDLEVSFNKGMNVLLGETGAGKSIIIDALSLLMGKRSNFDKIRNGETKAFIEGTFYLENNDLLKEINDKYDILDDNQIIVSRTLENNKSVCKVNYRNVPQSVLRDIMEKIIDIHSQHKDNSFFDIDKQLNYLDLYILKNEKMEKYSFLSLKTDFETKYDEYINEKKKYNSLLEKKNSFDDLDYLTYQCNELDKIDIKENEIEDIEDELLRLNSFEKIFDAYKNFEYDFNNASNLLYNAKKSLNLISDKSFSEQIERFNSLYYELDDCFEVIKDNFASFDSSQERIEYLNSRKMSLAPLRRKYGRSTEEIISKHKEIKEQIDLIINYDEVLEAQKVKVDNLYKACVENGKNLTEIRNIGKIFLENEVNAELKELSLENAKFIIDISKKELSNFGFDFVKFMLQANKGEKFLPLNQTASLGETSRLNLAFKIVFNKLNPVETFIFDEIDTGISGIVGSKISKKIHELSINSQSIVISHLPQMVAVSDHAYFVSKKVESDSTRTKIIKLDDNQLINELSKMLSGIENDESAKITARKMIESIKKC